MRKLVYLLVLVAMGTSSCRIFNPSVMVRTPSDFEFTQFKDSVTSQYRIHPHDLIHFRLFANDGFKIIDLTTSESNFGLNLSDQKLIEYQVEFDGKIKLPIIGRVDVIDLTIREAEALLEKRFSEFYVNPFIQLKVTNRRVLVFTGGRSSGLSNSLSNASGSATVIPLEDEAITVIEVLARAGGIIGSGKAHKIKLIRGDLKNPEVYLMDLSSIEGMKAANLYVEAGDIIYVEPTFSASTQLLDAFSRLLGLVSTSILTYVLVKNLDTSSP